MQKGNEHDFTVGEKNQLHRFLKEDTPAEEEDGEEEDGVDASQQLYDGNQARKRARKMLSSSKYRSAKHICSTTNMVERLLSSKSLWAR